jgi:hypothetical protein
MAEIKGMEEYHCTMPCNGGACILNVQDRSELPTTEGPLTVTSVFRSYFRLPYGIQPSERWWQVYAKNGSPISGYCKFVCANVTQLTTVPRGHNAPPPPPKAEAPAKLRRTKRR